MVSAGSGQPSAHDKTGDGQVKLYIPLHHKPPSGHGYEGADTWSMTPPHAPYEPSFITIPEFAGRRFWTWGIFALLEQVGEEVLAELRADGWEPWNDGTRELFLLLENQFAQTLIVVEAQGAHHYWARTADIQHAQRYPVLLTYQSGEEEYPHSVPPEMVIGACALVGDGSSFHLYTAEQLGEEGHTLCEQIREGMLLYPPEVDPSAEERRMRVEQRLAAWERTHAAAQRLSSLYWMLHQHTIGLNASSPPRTLPAVPIVIDKGALIASALPVQAVIAAYSNAHSGAEQWSIKKHLPTYAYSREDGTTHIQMRPGDPEAALDAPTIQSLWEQVRHLSDIDGDVLLTMMGQNEQVDGESRLMMLETIREYGLEALVDSGEMDVTRQAHALYYLQLSEEAEPHLDGPQQVVWLERLEREYDNIRTALRWSREQGGMRGNWEVALRLAIALRRFWMMRGYWNEGRRFFELVLAESVGVVGSLRARALSAAATLADYQGDYRRGETLCQESLAIWRTLQDMRGMAFSLYRLASMSSERGNFSLARSLYEEALELFREMGDQDRVAWSLAHLASLESIQGEHTRAHQLFEECLAHFRQLRNKEGVAWTLFNLAWTLFVAQHDATIVRSLLAESLVLCKELGARDSIASCLCYSGMVALHQGSMVAARSLLEESVALNREIGNRRALGQSSCGLASALILQGDLAAARALYEENLYLATEVDAKPVMVSALEGMAAAVAAQQERAAAAQLWGAAAALRDLMGMPMPPIEYAAYNRSVTSARIRLGKQTFTTAWARGRTRVQEQIVSIAEPITALTPSVAWLPLLPPMRSFPPQANELTKRESEVLHLLATGLTSAQIAEYLTISVLTVNSHIRSIYSKLGVTSRSAATRAALEQKLV